MAKKVAVIEKEFSELAEKLKLTHESLINNYEILTKRLERVVSQSGPLYAPEFSPKVQGLVEVIDTDIITRLEKLSEVTEELIKNYEEAIVNMDTSNN